MNQPILKSHSKMKFIIKIGLLLSLTAAYAPICTAEPSSEDLIYRQSVREDLVLESRSKKNFPKRNPNQYSRNLKDYFVVGEGSPLELEPTGVSSGSVVGA